MTGLTDIEKYTLAVALLRDIEIPKNAGHQQRCTEEALDALARALDVAKERGRQIKKGPPNARVNLGAGTTWSKEGWVALDKFHTGEGDNVVVGDLLHRDLPRIFDENSVEAIYSTHTFEHFTFAEANEILSDCFRVLKPGGAIRIVTPDLDIAAENFQKRNKEWWLKNEIQWYKEGADLSELDISWNFLKTIGVQMNPKYPLRTMREVIRGYHYSAYNFAIMSKLFSNAGFKKIKKKSCGVSDYPFFEDMDNRPVCSLYVEATK